MKGSTRFLGGRSSLGPIAKFPKGCWESLLQTDKESNVTTKGHCQDDFTNVFHL